MFRKSFLLLIIILIFLTFPFEPGAENRFPRPDFSSGYTIPSPAMPEPASVLFSWLDVLILAIALLSASVFVLKVRSRGGIVGVAFFSVFYFGFLRKGCVCPIGAIQNISLSLFQGGYAVSFPVLLFFILPLLFALFTGRIFCSSVCPFGALQDLVALRPQRIPLWLERALSILPVIYLTLTVVLSATGSGFIVCRLDPFIGFFRFGATFGMFIFGAILLLAGIFIARPYCRFLCPYGVLLGWVSCQSSRHLVITEDECISCRLCENICPMNAIKIPTPGIIHESREKAVKRLFLTILATPLFALLLAVLMPLLSPSIASLHPDVFLAMQLVAEKRGDVIETTDALNTFKSNAQLSEKELFARSDKIKQRVATGLAIAGAFIGICLGLKLLFFSIIRERKAYEPDKERCLSCGRCFAACPREAAQRHHHTNKCRNDGGRPG